MTERDARGVLHAILEREPKAADEHEVAGRLALLVADIVNAEPADGVVDHAFAERINRAAELVQQAAVVLDPARFGDTLQ